jgi:peptide/nickel transport system substrate-binding protein
MPEAWDVTSLTGAAGSGGCGKVSSGPMSGSATSKACAAVWKFDTDNNGLAKHPVMASDLSTYGSNPLWADGADGPWMLSAFDASSGQATYVPNPNYSGPQKPIISKFIEVPYTSDTAEYSALETGGATAPQVGYIPPQDVPQYNGSPGGVGQNASQVASNYTLVPIESWQINYFPYNFNSTGDGGQAGAIFHQLYIRQAFQSGVDQLGIIHSYYKGYGVPTYGPVPAYPPNPFESSLEKSPTGPYPFDIAKGVALLKAHGWTVTPGGTDTCAKPGSGSSDCGAGIAKGAKLSFSEVYASGAITLTEAVTDEVADWAKMGIHVTTRQESFNQVLGYAAPCKKGPSCTWELANWGGGWIFAPDYLPTGEEIFATGAGSNSGNYNDPTNNNLIHQTNISSSTTIFDNWENYLAKQLPVVFTPISETTAEISNKLGGVTPLNSLFNVTPEYWYFKK